MPTTDFDYGSIDSAEESANLASIKLEVGEAVLRALIPAIHRRTPEATHRTVSIIEGLLAGRNYSDMARELQISPQAVRDRALEIQAEMGICFSGGSSRVVKPPNR